MPHCRICGERLNRVHRSWKERLFFMGVFECRKCNQIQRFPRRYTFYLGENTRCPLCGTYRLRLLAEKDHIDRMLKTPINIFRRITGGKIYHCRFCRVQFYDKRPLAEQTSAKRLAG